MQAALQSRVERVVHTSSTAALGIYPNEVVDETYTFNVPPDRFIYGYSKFQAEEIVYEFAAQGLPVVIVNPTTVSITLSNPDGGFITNLAWGDAVIVAPESIDAAAI